MTSDGTGESSGRCFIIVVVAGVAGVSDVNGGSRGGGGTVAHDGNYVLVLCCAFVFVCLMFLYFTRGEKKEFPLFSAVNGDIGSISSEKHIQWDGI